MSSSCPACHQPVNDQSPIYPVVCPKCFQEYGPASDVAGHRTDGDTCLRRQLEIERKYRVAFDELHVKYKLQAKEHADLACMLNRAVEDSKKRVEEVIQKYEKWAHSRAYNLLTKRVIAWGTRVLGTKLLESRWERTMRLLEEALELAQAELISRDEASTLLDYVYNRPKGQVEQEAGGIMVCMMAWAHAAKVDLEKAMVTEVDRIEGLDAEKVRAKQRLKIDFKVGLEPDV